MVGTFVLLSSGHVIKTSTSSPTDLPLIFKKIYSISNKERKNLNFKDISERFFSAYFRFNVTDKPGVLSNITQIFSRNKVSIKRLVQDPNKNKSSSSIIIITHPSKDKSLNKIIQTINKRSYVKKRSKLIRIDDV